MLFMLEMFEFQNFYFFFVTFSIIIIEPFKHIYTGVPQPIRPLVVCIKIKQKMILAKFCPSLTLGRIRIQRFA